MGTKRIYFYLDPSVTCRESQKIYIGYGTGNGMMRPNANFRDFFPRLWKEWSGEDPVRHVYSLGLYALVLGISHTTGLYGALVQAYGPQHANAIIDFAAYCIKYRSNAAQNYGASMDGSVLFSEKAYSDSWYGKMFGTITDEQNERFMELWMEKVKEGLGEGGHDVWIAVDGSNSDSDVKEGSRLPRHGHAKSNTSSKVVGYLYAVVAPGGLPVCFDVHPGNVVDTKGMQDMKIRLEKSGYKVSGLLIDRFFCNQPLLSQVTNDGWEYVVMLKESDSGFKQMYGKYGAEIKDRFKYLVSEEAVFGVASRGSIFKGSEEVCLGLFYDGENGGARSRTFVKKVLRALRDARAAIGKGEVPSIPKEMSRYIIIAKDPDGRITGVEPVDEACQHEMDSKGYCAIASSLDMDAGNLNRTYHLRDASEKNYSIVGTQLGNNVTRTHKTQGIKSKHVISFVASIIRNHIMNTCLSMDIPTNEFIQDLSDIHLRLATDSSYAYVRNASSNQLAVLGKYGVTEEVLNAIAVEFTKRVFSDSHVSMSREGVFQSRDMQDAAAAPGNGAGEEATGRKKATGKRSGKDVEIVKRSPGRPKGAKDAVQRHRRTNEELGKTPAKRKRKSKVRVETEEAPATSGGPKAMQTEISVQKGKRGRPKGSKNKKTLEREAEQAKIREAWKSRLRSTKEVKQVEGDS